MVTKSQHQADMNKIEKLKSLSDLNLRKEIFRSIILEKDPVAKIAKGLEIFLFYQLGLEGAEELLVVDYDLKHPPIKEEHDFSNTGNLLN
jgi:hypothetical protein